jgi:hypothetical protein
MSKNPLIIIAGHWFDAFNEHNLEKLIALYSADAKHYSPKLKLRTPETKGLIIGKKALEEWWRDCFKTLPTLRYKPQNFISDDSGVFMEYIRSVEGESDLLVGEVLEIKDELIVSSRVYHG